MNVISVRGASEHNLKEIDVDIPKNCLVTFTGPSGSGKTSLVFDTIYAESFRRFAEASHVPSYVISQGRFSVSKRPKVRSISGLPPALGISQRQGVVSKLSTVGTLTSIVDLFRVYFAAFGEAFCRKCEIPLMSLSYEKILEKILETFSAQKIKVIFPIATERKGAFTKEIEKFKDLGFSKIIINEVIYDLQDLPSHFKLDAKKLNTLEIIVDYFEISEKKISRLEKALNLSFQYSSGLVKIVSSDTIKYFNTKSSCPQCHESSEKLDPRHFSHSSLGQCHVCQGTGTESDSVHADLFICSACRGSRLSSGLPIVKVYGKRFTDIVRMSLFEIQKFLKNNFVSITPSDKSKLKIISEIIRICDTLISLNLGFLILNRSANSLSPGDLQRIRLSGILSNKLNGVLYVLDEPCQGLMNEEVINLIELFKLILKENTTIICVEHHPKFLSLSDKIFTIGPGAGVHGGKIVSNNEKVFPVMNIDHSFKNEDRFPLLKFSSISIRDLKIDSVSIKQSKFNLLRGPSGSGKSSFVDLCLLPYLNAKKSNTAESEFILPFIPKQFCDVTSQSDLIVNDINFIKPGLMTRSSRRIVAAALDIINPIRQIFSALSSSQVLGLSPMHFSWNSKLGQCEKCRGKGHIELSLKYLQTVHVTCEECMGARLQSKSLVPRFKGLNLAEILNLSIEDASKIFENQKSILTKLERAHHFGLGYVLLGQTMDSLSGGEMQRLNLILELKKTDLAGCWYVLFHPSTGLHTPDIFLLVNLIKQMCEKGATFVAIENREEFLEQADNVTHFS